MPFEPGHLQVRMEEDGHPVRGGLVRQPIILVELLSSEVDTCLDVTTWLVPVPFPELFKLP